MNEVTMYSTQRCPFCQQAEQLLRRKGVGNLKKIAVDREPGMLETMISRTGRRSVPQIFIGETHVGGYDDLAALDRVGQLDALLQTIGDSGP
ncbi:MAG: glutaredoxin 3 [Candidatus Competibacteraceae bacterium]|nr:glutaredoxin 3 [Candidatus Competibacteraceae bacterium]HRY15411.1 glutaredoxin 3 [Candidatus Competibacteraceae bacterium]